MGYTSYNFSARSVRSKEFSGSSTDQIFKQNISRRMHESMDPKNALIRESRDSEQHPNTVPIIFSLDVTGSMRKIPEFLVKEGLPKLVSKMVQVGILDPQILFLAIGDAITDRCPLQVGQFESGDEELDMWLTRTYLEGGGGANSGESYNLAWLYASKHTIIDSFDKRGKKGFLFTVGDEPCLPNVSERMIREIFEKKDKTYSNEELIAMASEKYNIYHLQILEGQKGHQSLPFWQNLLGQNCIPVTNHTQVSDIVSDIVINNMEKPVPNDTNFTVSDNITSVDNSNRINIDNINVIL